MDSLSVKPSKTTVTSTEHSSVNSTVSSIGKLSHIKVNSSVGLDTIVGAVMSSIIISWVTFNTFPQASVIL